MLNIKNIKTVLLFVVIPFFAFTQCPEETKIQAAINSKDSTQMRLMAELLLPCNNLQDSVALLYHKLGVRYYINGRYDKAIHYTLKGLDLRTKNLDPGHFDISASCHNLGVFYKGIDNLDAAEKYFKRAGEIREKLDNTDMVESYTELARVQNKKGEYDRAIQSLDFALQKAKIYKDEGGMVSCYLEYGNILPEKKLYQQAIDSLINAKNILDLYAPDWDHAVCYTNLALNYLAQKKYEEAIDYGKKSTALWQAFQAPYELSTSLNNLGLAYIKTNQFEQARIILEKGRTVSIQNNIPFSLSQSFDNLAELYLAQNENEKAVLSFHDAVRTLVKDFNNPDYLSNPSKEQILNASLKRPLLNDISDKARSMLILFEETKKTELLSKCLETYKLCDYLVDLLRKEQVEESTKLFWREKVIPIYENAIHASMVAKDKESAFFFFEKSKAILLMEALQISDALSMVPDSVREDSYSLKRLLLSAREEVENANKKNRTEKLKLLIEVQSAFDKKIENISQQYPRYFNANIDVDVVNLSNFQKDYLKSGDKNSIHFFYGAKNVYALKTMAQDAQIYNLGSTQTIESEIRKLLTFFEKSSNIENAPQDFLQQSTKLYNLLLKPLNIEDAKELIIFPDGALAYLPFETLTIAVSDNLASAPYLIRDHMTRYGYSATILSKQNILQNDTPKSIIAFAPFAEKSTDANHPVLAFSDDELGKIQDKIDGFFFKNKEASRQNFLKNLHQHGVFHLSTHAFSSPTETKPHIVFADTSLYLSELYTLDFSANLVVLSACQTNIGQLSPGEGVMSLGRGFTYAGARSLISSLWNVNAASTSKILAGFYDNILKNRPKYEALHLAKKAYLENELTPAYERSPYYWAGLVYYGDDGGVVLKQSKSNTYLWITFIALLLAISGFFIWKLKRTS